MGNNLIIRKNCPGVSSSTLLKCSFMISLLSSSPTAFVCLTFVSAVQHKVSFFFCRSPGKQLDSDDQYYRELPTSRSEPRFSAEGPTASSSSRRRSFGQEQQALAPAGRQTRERAVTEPEPHRPTRDNRSVLHLQSFLHLLGPYFSFFHSLIFLHEHMFTISSALNGLFLV